MDHENEEQLEEDLELPAQRMQTALTRSSARKVEVMRTAALSLQLGSESPCELFAVPSSRYMKTTDTDGLRWSVDGRCLPTMNATRQAPASDGAQPQQARDAVPGPLHRSLSAPVRPTALGIAVSIFAGRRLHTVLRPGG
jgi:hypothetical protein